ncbi:hypothetical protein DFH08DRAFT_1082318 [Mycena albidolilacea]|uniref:Uncharacterized protein n=1 Tax=Mycena albidolilacea TaxID=1033008 RepID=A0AAD6ZV43_9AGAR|nr:hypothetical protein DFH08DRAFT_1082318 [Mycena albidolilacea]
MVVACLYVVRDPIIMSPARFAQGYLAVLASVPSRVPLFAINCRCMLLSPVHVAVQTSFHPQSLHGTSFTKGTKATPTLLQKEAQAKLEFPDKSIIL